MKKDKHSKKKSNLEQDKDVENYLKGELEIFIKHYQTKYPYLPDRWVRNQTQLFKWICALPPKQCLAMLGLCFSATETIKQYKNIPDDSIYIYYFQTLINFGMEDDHESLKLHCSNYGIFGLTLGYKLIEILVTKRLLLHFRNYPTVISALLVRASSDLDLGVSQNQALDQLSKFVRNIYKKRTGKDVETEDIPFHLWQVIRKHFPRDLLESYILAAEGNTKIKYIPNATAMDLIKKPVKKKKVILVQSLDLPIAKDSELTFKDTLKSDFNPDELLEILDKKTIISRCLELIDNPAILTERERQVIKIRLEDTSLEEVGKELGIARQTVREIERTALKKLGPHLKHFK